MGIDMFSRDKLEAAAGVKQPMVAFAKTNPDVRLIDGRFMEIQQAMGTPKRAPGPRGGAALSRRLHRGDEGLGLRRRRAQAQQPARRRGGAAGASELNGVVGLIQASQPSKTR